MLAHETREEYSSWLLPAVGRVLRETGLRMGEVGGYAVAAGPGSFTGVRVGLTSVIAPARFVETAVELASAEKITWASPDAHLLSGEDAWRERERRGESIEPVSATLGGTLGRIGLRLLKEGKTTDALGLDANYVRRSDAEIFWKGGAAHGH